MLEKVIKACKKAGEEILEVYSKEFTVEEKEDRTPVTEADRRAHRIITEELKETRIPVLSEEGKEIPFKERRKWKRFWLVDPLDGTKEFIKKNGEFTVNVALVEEGEPVLGVVYAPALEVLYFAEKGNGAYREVKGKMEKLPIGNWSRENLRVVASRSHMNEETKKFLENLEKKFGKLQFLSKGSSLKICMVAEGSADIYPRIAPTMEWDTGAGHAVAKEAGCELFVYEEGKLREPLRYNKEDLRNPSFVCLSLEIKELVEATGGFEPP
ncbi:3'(2'),5'-bisphosphate nucleotidase CysQ [Aquifex aeolicus]|uniref:3'(2'),5'-bisphosphate nucleotidase CysQ n=1 Tax=Aquifex aeolicus (strain VF5) TaxID=224324 RepID=O66669_AQUAE|nr:3'(2'),5'-bisphosphate nucleotidase CysQ [Aquifex aeolicus]AAC06626.1 CysQ protein [Aquifex aeolicus VF5]